MSDQGLVKVIGDYVKFHRLHQNRSQEEVARSAGIGRSTLSLLERGESVTLTTLLQILRVLNRLEVMDQFTVQTEESPLELARKEQQKRQRASGRGGTSTASQSDW